MHSGSIRLIGLAAVVVATSFIGGCSSLPLTNKIETTTAAGAYQEALTIVENSQSTYYNGANSLLYYFDRAALLQRLQNYQASSRDLEQAELLIEEFTVTSITQATTSFLVNDMTMDYSGEDFEQVMVNAINALNYLYDQDYQGAGVEARKVNTRLVVLNDKYEGKAVYKEDAFARYLSAFAHEALGDYNSAYIDYKKAYQGFKDYHRFFSMPIPMMIRADLLRLARWQGFEDDYQYWRKEFGRKLPTPSRRPVQQAELMLVVYDGLIPSKRTKYVAAPITTPDDKPYTLKVAFPEFAPREPAISRVRIGTPAGKIYVSQVVEPLSSIAYKNLEQRLGLIAAKAIARATAKYIAAYQVRRATKSSDQGVNLLVGLATNIFTMATEQADTRSWRTLPNRFHIIRLPLEPGRHELEVRVEGLIDGSRPGYPLVVELNKGQKKVLPVFIPN